MTPDEMLATPDAVAPTPENVAILIEALGRMRDERNTLRAGMEAEGNGALHWIAAIVHHFGGSVILTEKEMRKALELGLERAEQGDGSIIIRTLRERSGEATNDAMIEVPPRANLQLPPNS